MDPNSPEALAQALMGQQQPDPYENMHGTGPQGNVAGSLLGGMGSALLHGREALMGQTQPSKEDLESGKVQIPSWQSSIPQAVNMGMQAGGAGGPAGAALHLTPRILVEPGASLEKMGSSVFKQMVGGNREYTISNDSGKFVGGLHASSESPFSNDVSLFDMTNHKPGEVHVDALWGPGANSMGPKETVNMIRELKREYPDLETLSGTRVTGARGKAYGGAEDSSMKIPATVKPAAPFSKPFIDRPLNDDEYEAVNKFEENFNKGKPFGTGSYISTQARDGEGNIRLYDSDFTHIGTIPEINK